MATRSPPLVATKPAPRGEGSSASHGLDPNDAKHWEEAEEAVEALREGNPIGAIVALRGVIRSSPRNAYAYHYLGIALFESSELEAARDAYRAALLVAPRYLGARVHLSHVLRMLGDATAAIREGEAARRQAPTDPDVWHALGVAHAQRGDKDAARHYLEGYLRSHPEPELANEVREILTLVGPPAPESD